MLNSAIFTFGVDIEVDKSAHLTFFISDFGILEHFWGLKLDSNYIIYHVELWVDTNVSVVGDVHIEDNSLWSQKKFYKEFLSWNWPGYKNRRKRIYVEYTGPPELIWLFRLITEIIRKIYFSKRVDRLTIYNEDGLGLANIVYDRL